MGPPLGTACLVGSFPPGPAGSPKPPLASPGPVQAQLPAGTGLTWAELDLSGKVRSGESGEPHMLEETFHTSDHLP